MFWENQHSLYWKNMKIAAKRANRHALIQYYISAKFQFTLNQYSFLLYSQILVSIIFCGQRDCLLCKLSRVVVNPFLNLHFTTCPQGIFSVFCVKFFVFRNIPESANIRLIL